MTPQRRKANNALGALVICGFFLAETLVNDHFRPNPLSPVIWSLLTLAAIGSLGAYFWFASRDRRQQ